MIKIIAEIGVNWCGDIQIAKEMIFQSKRAGADAVKFQMFNEEIIKGNKYEEELSKMILDFQKINELRGYAFQNRIGFGVSIMYPEAFEMIDNKLGVPVDFIKIRCQDNSNEKISRPAVDFCNKWNIPLLISSETPIFAEEYFMYNLYPTDHAKYLYCVPKYPPELTEISYNMLKKEFGFNGYSNHYPSKYLPMLAVAENLEFVEVHIKRETFDECCQQDQIDKNVSIGFDDLKEVCDFRDLLLEMSGN